MSVSQTNDRSTKLDVALLGGSDRAREPQQRLRDPRPGYTRLTYAGMWALPDVLVFVSAVLAPFDVRAKVERDHYRLPFGCVRFQCSASNESCTASPTICSRRWMSDLWMCFRGAVSMSTQKVSCALPAVVVVTAWFAR
jgi:hypothetical protein